MKTGRENQFTTGIGNQGSGIRDQKIHAALRAGKGRKPTRTASFFAAAKPPVTSSDP
jgi:hypothetical protein